MRSTLRQLTLVLLALALSACAGEVAEERPPTARPATAVARQQRATRTPVEEPDVPTLAPSAEPIGPTAEPGSDAPTALPSPTTETLPTPEPSPTSPLAPLPPTPTGVFEIPPDFREGVPGRELPGFGYEKLQLQEEAEAFFAWFYQARSLEPGGAIDVGTLRNLVAGAYADYTLPLVSRDVRDAEQGKLRSLRFELVGVTIDEWKPLIENNIQGEVLVSVTRTRISERTDRVEPPQTGTYRFKVERGAAGGAMVSWLVTDFFNPDAGRWVSEAPPAGDAQLQAELDAYFEEFYAARSLEPGELLDLERVSNLTRLSYRTYTLKLLQEQQQEVVRGRVRSISYSDRSVRLLSYDPLASNHGGMAEVAVTRTAHITRDSGADSPETATYRFRVHRHFDESGAPAWLAVDFFQPSAQRWVSELAGQSVPLPPGGYG